MFLKAQRYLLEKNNAEQMEGYAFGMVNSILPSSVK